ncbi:11248_t:CDS:2 [Entrophospora sp. SA101]|nr:11248_t:CDS:2 [Entrophospora sp. SA101]
MSELNISVAKSSRDLNKKISLCQSTTITPTKNNDTFHSQMSCEKIKKYSNYEEIKFNETLTQMSCNTNQIKSQDINLLTSLLHTCFSIREMIYTYSDYSEIISVTGVLESLYCKYNMEKIETSDAYTKMELFIAIGTVSAQITEALNSRQMFEDKLHKMQIDFPSNILNTANSQEAPSFLVNSSKNSQHNKEQSCRMQTDPLSVLWFIKYLIDHNLKRPDKRTKNLN